MVLQHNLAFIEQAQRPDEDQTTKLMKYTGAYYQLSMITNAIKLDGVISRGVQSGLGVSRLFGFKERGCTHELF